jgi:hypothetical protein
MAHWAKVATRKALSALASDPLLSGFAGSMVNESPEQSRSRTSHVPDKSRIVALSQFPTVERSTAWDAQVVGISRFELQPHGDNESLRGDAPLESNSSKFVKPSRKRRFPHAQPSMEMSSAQGTQQVTSGMPPMQASLPLPPQNQEVAANHVHIVSADLFLTDAMSGLSLDIFKNSGNEPKRLRMADPSLRSNTGRSSARSLEKAGLSGLQNSGASCRCAKDDTLSWPAYRMSAALQRSRMVEKSSRLVDATDFGLLLRTRLRFSSVAIGMVMSRKNDPSSWRQFVEENPSIFLEDPAIFLHGAQLALQTYETWVARTVARYCVECYQLLETCRQEAAERCKGLLSDLYPGTGGSRVLSEDQRQRLQSFYKTTDQTLDQISLECNQSRAGQQH